MDKIVKLNWVQIKVERGWKVDLDVKNKLGVRILRVIDYLQSFLSNLMFWSFLWGLIIELHVLILNSNVIDWL